MHVTQQNQKQVALKLTTEQAAIVESQGNIKINAVAGSGKTSTLIAYAQAHPKEKILYLAFNRSVKLEAIRKFAEADCDHVKIETAHSLAFRAVVRSGRYRIQQYDLTTYQIKDILNLKSYGEPLSEFVMAGHISRLMSFFCNSNKAKVQELDYLSIVSGEEAREFVKKHNDEIVHQTRVLLAKMNRAEIEITHDFYLKKFQLHHPILPYDCILFDEGQDASPAMLDIFLQQDHATRVIVGDTHQQIYRWRFAINSLEQVPDFNDFYLTKSFRLNTHMSKLAEAVIGYKYLFEHQLKIAIEGVGKHKGRKVKATIGRTNLALLVKSIDMLVDNGEIENVYFEGNFSSYTYAKDGGSIYDVLNLYTDYKQGIRDKLIKSMSGLDDLEDYADKTDDVELKTIIEIVKKYGRKLPYLIKELKERHLPDNEKGKADMIFSTVHRCKGMEYDEVTLLDDFITQDAVEKLWNDEGATIADYISEEINLLYVAVTRAKNRLNIPEKLLPKGFDLPPTNHIKVLRAPKPAKKNPEKAPQKVPTYRKSQPSYANKKWTDKEENELLEMYYSGVSIEEMASYFERTKGAVYFRLKKMGVLYD